MRKASIFFAFIFIALLFSSTATAQNRVSTYPVVLQLETETFIADLDWNYDGTLLAFADANDGVSIINVNTDKIDPHLESNKDQIYIVNTIAWHPKQNYLLIANNLTKIWDNDHESWLSSFEFPKATKFEQYTFSGNADWHPSGERFAAILRQCKEGTLYRPGARVEIWDMRASSSSEIANCLWSGTPSVKWNPQGTELAINGFASFDSEGFINDEQIEIWDVTKKERILTIAGLKGSSGLDWSPNGDMIAFTTHIGIDQYLQVRKVTNGEIVSQTKVNLKVYVPLVWHPSKNLIAAGGNDGSVKIWNTLNGAELVELPVHEGEVTDVRWSPDGSMLASTGEDGKLIVWRTSDLIGQATTP